MANLTRLGKGATKKIHAAIGDLFDKAKARLLGPQSIEGKKIYITFQRELSLPGIFEAGSMEEYVRPDLDVLNSLIRVASAYVDAHKERTKARIMHEINGALAEAKHKGGMSRQDFRDLVNTKLSDVWAEVTRNIHSIVDTEVAHAKNVSVLDGILGVNVQAGIDDPVVYFVVVRDGELCSECKRLHLMEDEKTPRLWYLSELGHGYHKKGEDNPKVGGLHPHCRCTIVTLLPSYGFTKDGMVKYVKRGHLELPVQRGLERSEVVEISLQKADWDSADHPRDPDTGEFTEVEDVDEQLEAEEERSALFAQRSLEEGIHRGVQEFKDCVADGICENTPEAAMSLMRAMHVWPQDKRLQAQILEEVAKFQKEEMVFRTVTHSPLSVFASKIRTQMRRERHRAGNPVPAFIPEDAVTGPEPDTRLRDRNTLLALAYQQKLHSASPHALVLKYLIHRIENVDAYETNAEGLDNQFIESFHKHLDRRRVIGRATAKEDRERTLFPNAHGLREFLIRHGHLVDSLMDHQKEVHKWFKDNGHDEDIDGVPHVALARGLNTKNGARRPPEEPLRMVAADHDGCVLYKPDSTTKKLPPRSPDLLTTSWTDVADEKHSLKRRFDTFYHSWVPMKNVWMAYNLLPSHSWYHPRRWTEDEYLVSPPSKLVGCHPLEMRSMTKTAKRPKKSSEAVSAKPPTIRRVSQLQKMAIKDIKVGPAVKPHSPMTDDYEHDYSHLLPQELRAKGFSLMLTGQIHGGKEYNPHTNTWARTGPGTHWLEANLVTHEPQMTDEQVRTQLIRKPQEQWDAHDKMVYALATTPKRKLWGHAVGQVKEGVLRPHFNDGVLPAMRGHGLGKVLYSAIFGHAHNALGAHTVKGNFHSVHAGKVHEALSAEHGMAYKADEIPVDTLPDQPKANLKHFVPSATRARGPYEYAIKKELSGTKPRLPRRLR